MWWLPCVSYISLNCWLHAKYTFKWCSTYKNQGGTNVIFVSRSAPVTTRKMAEFRGEADWTLFTYTVHVATACTCIRVVQIEHKQVNEFTCGYILLTWQLYPWARQSELVECSFMFWYESMSKGGKIIKQKYGWKIETVRVQSDLLWNSRWRRG